MAAWKQSQGELVLRMNVSSLPENEQINFTFSLLNSEDGTGANNVMIKGYEVLTSWYHFTVPSGKTAPLMVHSLTITGARIAQSSPWPCDNNTIHIQFNIVGHIPQNCNPMITIDGLDFIHDSNMLEVTNVNTNETSMHMWSQSKLTLDLVKLMNQSCTQTTSSFDLKFTLENPIHQRGSIPVHIAGSLYKSRTVIIPRVPMQNLTETISFEGYATSSVVPTAEDAYVGLIRGVQMEGSVFQSTTLSFNVTNPCLPVKITVSFNSTVPLIPACGHGVTVSGLRGSATEMYEFSSNSLGDARFVRSTGTLQTKVTSVIKAGELHTIDFMLTHRANASAGDYQVDLNVIELTSVAASLDTTSHGMDAIPMRVASLHFKDVGIWQTSPFACSPNTITVTLKS
eukprot:459405-Hanusia_phi.AAC.1